MPISVIPYRSSKAWPLISRHRSKTVTGRAADPETMSRRWRTPPDQRSRSLALAPSHSAISFA
jgi:hypothetical protein